jgi:hypothetical protein
LIEHRIKHSGAFFFYPISQCSALNAVTMPFRLLRLIPGVVVADTLAQILAQANSTPSMASPIGMTMRPGPGVTSMMMPSNSTVDPTASMAMRRAVL